MVDKYIDTDVVGGDGDGTSWANAYATAALWEAGEGASLSDDHTGHFRASSGTADEGFTINGFTPNAFMLYMTNEDGSSGYWDVTKYRVDEPTGVAIAIQCENTHLKHFQVASDDANAIEFFNTAAADISIEGTIVKGNATKSFSGGIKGQSVGGANSTLKIWNCVIYDWNGSGQSGIILNDADVDFYIFNNTFHNNTDGMFHSAVNQEYCRNNRIAGADAWGSSGWTDNDAINDYNYIVENDNHVANGSNGAFNQTFLYENEGADQFAPTTGDPCISAGDDLSGDANIAVTDDILGVARDGTNPTVGAHEFVAAAGGPNWQINISDAWKDVPAAFVNIGDAWKAIPSSKTNISDTWEDS